MPDKPCSPTPAEGLLRSEESLLITYLAVLDRQRDAIRNGAVEQIVFYTDYEEDLIGRIRALHRVRPGGPLPDPALRRSVEALRRAARAGLDANTAALNARMAHTKHTWETLKRSVPGRPSVYTLQSTPERIDYRC